MDNELALLEAELKSLRPVAPLQRLESRIARELAAESAERTSAPLFWYWAGALPVAAALALGIGTLMQRDLSRPWPTPASATVQAAASEDVLKPVAMENVLYSARDEGVVTLDDGTRARRERLRYVDTITWKNPRTNASLQWSVPREEVRVVPVSFH